MRMIASWSGSKRTYRIQVRGVKMRRNGELPSDHTQIGNVRRRSFAEVPLSLYIVPRRAQASKPAPAKAGGAAKHKRRWFKLSPIVILRRWKTKLIFPRISTASAI